MNLTIKLRSLERGKYADSLCGPTMLDITRGKSCQPRTKILKVFYITVLF